MLITVKIIIFLRLTFLNVLYIDRTELLHYLCNVIREETTDDKLPASNYSDTSPPQ